MDYHDRPSISPVVAALFASGVIKRDDAIIDLGCGSGIDCITLGSWGFRRVVGIDLDRDAMKKAERFANRHKLRIPEFHEGNISQRHDCFSDEEFDVAVDSLLFNNVPPQAVAGYVRQVARILRPGGLLILQQRENGPRFEVVPALLTLPSSFRRRFTFGSIVTTDIPEFRTSTRRRAHARITLCIGRKRARVDGGKDARGSLR